METRLTIDYDKQWLNCVSAIVPYCLCFFLWRRAFGRNAQPVSMFHKKNWPRGGKIILIQSNTTFSNHSINDNKNDSSYFSLHVWLILSLTFERMGNKSYIPYHVYCNCIKRKTRLYLLYQSLAFNFDKTSPRVVETNVPMIILLFPSPMSISNESIEKALVKHWWGFGK